MNTFRFNRIASPLISKWDSDPFPGDELASTNFFNFPSENLKIEEEHDFDFLCFGRSKIEEEPESPTFIQAPKFAVEDCFNNKITVVKTKTSSKDLFAQTLIAAEVSDDDIIRPKKKIQKAKSVKMSKKKLTEKKKRRKQSAAKSAKNSLEKKRLNSIETCSTISNSANSTGMTEESLGENAVIDFKKIIDIDVNKTFKLESRGVKSNVPQIFNSTLFSKADTSKEEELSNCFINTTLTMLKNNRNEDMGNQITNVTSMLGQLKIFKETNLEAGSYMASLETTIESISKMKNLL